MKSGAIALIVIASLLSPTVATAKAAATAQCGSFVCEEPGSVEERISDCEAALDSADEAINSQATTIDALSAQNDRLQRSLDFAVSEAARAKAWYNDPKYVAPIALVLGVALGAYAAKR